MLGGGFPCTGAVWGLRIRGASQPLAPGAPCPQLFPPTWILLSPSTRTQTPNPRGGEHHALPGSAGAPGTPRRGTAHGGGGSRPRARPAARGHGGTARPSGGTTARRAGSPRRWPPARTSAVPNIWGGEAKIQLSTSTSHPPGNRVPPLIPNSPQDAVLPVPGGTGAHQAEERPCWLHRLWARGAEGTGAPGEDKKGVRKPELLPLGALHRPRSRCPGVPVPVSHRAAAPSSVRLHPAMALLCSARPRAPCRYRGGTAPGAR